MAKQKRKYYNVRKGSHLLLVDENLNLQGRKEYMNSGHDASRLKRKHFQPNVRDLWSSHEIVVFTDYTRGVDGTILKCQTKPEEL